LQPDCTLSPGELDLLAGEYRFAGGQIREVLREARSVASLRECENTLSARDISEAVRNLSSSVMAGLAERLQPLFGWDDIVLPARVLQQLHEVEASVRFRPQVHARWDFQRKTGPHAGVTVLFSGVSGTGKTMAAGVLARSLGLELYRIDLSRVV